jgi:hypothetical protein
MSVRSCKVTVKDMDGVAHTVDVTAETLYEAVALGLATLRKDEWVAGVATGMNTVKVRVTEVAVEHEVRITDFMNWLDGISQGPRDIVRRQRIRLILGMEKSSTRG